MGILNICNLWILLRKTNYLVGYTVYLFAVKVDGNDVIAGICLHDTSLQIPALTSLPSTLTAQKSMKMDVFCWLDILQFFLGKSKDYKY